jgi:hypothetical protein
MIELEYYVYNLLIESLVLSRLDLTIGMGESVTTFYKINHAKIHYRSNISTVQELVNSY